ncbi:Lipase 2 [compost metagenome]
MGYSVVSTSYRFIPEHPWPAQLEDVVDVFQEVASSPQKYGLQAKNFILSGRSAGGHLALVAGLRLRDPRIQGIISFYPVVDFKLFFETGYPGDLLDTPTLLSQLLRSTPQSNPEIYANINPVNFISPYSPPVLLLHGDRDSVVSVRHSQIMAEHLRASRIPYYLLELPYESHGFDLNLNGPGGQAASFAVRQFLTSIFEKSAN